MRVSLFRLARMTPVALLMTSASMLVQWVTGGELTVQWSQEHTTPAIVTGSDTRFVSLAPCDEELSAQQTIQLKNEENEIEGKVLFIDPTTHLCLVEAAQPIPDLEAVKFPPFPMPGAGEKLNSHMTGASCPTRVMGQEYSVKGEPMSAPLLKVRIADTEKFNHPGTLLFCDGGRLFGIVANSDCDGEGEAHAIPGICANKLAIEYERFQRSGRVKAGLMFNEESQTPTVLKVAPDSAADTAGILPGDVILSVQHYRIQNLDELTKLVHLLIAGDPVDVNVLRGLEEVTLQITPELAEVAEHDDDDQ